MRYSPLALASVLLILSTDAFAWGSKGHQTVGAIADQLIAGSSAAKHIKAILPADETLSDAATWADRVKGSPRKLDADMKRYVEKNKQHRQYHYTDVPFEAERYKHDGLGTTDHDIVVTLEQCIATLRGAQSGPENPHRFTQREALRLLVHLVGDVHQPLHVGSGYINDRDQFFQPRRESDVDDENGFGSSGGNSLLVTKSRSLHAYWDDQAVTDAMRTEQVKSPSAFATALIRATPTLATSKSPLAQWPTEWGTEALGVSRLAYRNVVIHDRVEREGSRHGQHPKWMLVLPKDYKAKAADIASTQLTRAGYRLAAVLKTIWP